MTPPIAARANTNPSGTDTATEVLSSSEVGSASRAASYKRTTFVGQVSVLAAPLHCSHSATRMSVGELAGPSLSLEPKPTVVYWHQYRNLSEQVVDLQRMVLTQMF
ncbi:unnamed protein product [Prorocentrum cordatum]|uniref:Uncharacterized protein n=1 Tax=Prorocentrum cordatum TaxID=2364126 RepID=A0ABN9XVB2_9DINO|nr:unnamed protein product [Polarella glacialis]